MWEMTGNDATLSGDKYPDIVKNIARMTISAWAEENARPVKERAGCEVPDCQCNGRVEYMGWGSDYMTETDDSEYEDPVDRDNRLYVESCNYDLSADMTPMTYTPPLRRNRRRRYEVRKKYETDIEDSICDTIDDGFLTDEEWPISEHMVQQGWLLIMLTGQLETGTITVDVGRGPEVKMTLPAMKILIWSTDRSRNRRRQGPVLKQTVSV